MMASTYDNIFRKSGIYGAPLPSSLNGEKLPDNPRIITPDIVKRAGGAVEGWQPGNKNEDLLEGVTE